MCCCCKLMGHARALRARVIAGQTGIAVPLKLLSGNNSKPQEANSRGGCSFLCYNLGILHQILPWNLRIAGKFCPHQLPPFQMSHVPTPPPPLPRSSTPRHTDSPIPLLCSLSLCTKRSTLSARSLSHSVLSAPQPLQAPAQAPA